MQIGYILYQVFHVYYYMLGTQKNFLIAIGQKICFLGKEKRKRANPGKEFPILL